MVEDLPQGYYLDNFRYLVQFVVSRYEDILSEDEQRFCREFDALTDDGKKTLVRLLGRRHDHVRQDKCQYLEIADFEAAIIELKNAGLLTINDLDDALGWLGFATRPELLSAFPNSTRSLKKQQLCEEIAAYHSLDDIRQRLPFDLLTPTCGDKVQTLKLLFFGNLHQDFTDFVLHDLGVVPYESYSLDSNQRYFNQRSVLEQTLAVYELQTTADEALSNIELNLAEFARHLLKVLPDAKVLEEPRLLRRYSKVLNRVGRQLEREAEPKLAIEVYSYSNLAPARERQARVLVDQGDIDSALVLCESIVREPSLESEYEFAASFARRVVKKYLDNEAPEWLPEASADHFEIIQLTKAQVPDVNVEEVVASHFREDDHFAQHVENGLLPGLFGLLFWDVIFAPIPGVFFHPFQRGPDDLFSGQFVKNRKAMIDSKFRLLRDTHHFSERVIATFEAKYGIANHFVMWRYLSEDLLRLAIERVPMEHLALVFQRMLRDLKSNRSGFPDLVVFPKNGGYELVEVKGPGDTLQANQKRWLRYFSEHGIPAKVAQVSWQT